jgi:hypothetical protein
MPLVVATRAKFGPNFWLSVIFWAKLMQNEPRLDVVADQTRLAHRLDV